MDKSPSIVDFSASIAPRELTFWKYENIRFHSYQKFLGMWGFFLERTQQLKDFKLGLNGLLHQWPALKCGQKADFSIYGIMVLYGFMIIANTGATTCCRLGPSLSEFLDKFGSFLNPLLRKGKNSCITREPNPAPLKLQSVTISLHHLGRHHGHNPAKFLYFTIGRYSIDQKFPADKSPTQ
jgi:hypothetical protein